jgi:xylose isomerase
MSKKSQYRFSFGPWNISEGSDPFGPNVRAAYPHEKKFKLYKSLGFDGVQFHDDDVVPGLEKLKPAQIMAKAGKVAKELRAQGLVAEFVAPRLWFAAETVDGGYTSNSKHPTGNPPGSGPSAASTSPGPSARRPSCSGWPARAPTSARRSVRSSPTSACSRPSMMLAYDRDIEIWIEPKPNEPTDLAYVPTTGHAIALAYASRDPKRVKALIESAHALLAGLDPSDEMAFALAHGKLGSVHLNDQNGLKYDQDKNFGSANLRAAFNQVLVLDNHGYGKQGEFIGLDVKAMRTQRG